MKRNRKTLIVLVVILALASTGLAAFAMQPSARDLLVTALETTEGVTDGHAVATFEFDVQGEEGSGTIEVWGQMEAGPNGEPAFRLEVLDANLAEFIGVTAVADGNNMWIYYPEQNQVLTGTYEEVAAKMAEQFEGRDLGMDEFDHEGWEEKEGDHPENAEAAVDRLLENFTAERTGGERMGDTNALIVRLVPIPEEMPDEVRAAGGFLNVWLRTSDRALLGVELAESVAGYGKAMATTLDVNEGIDAAVFTFAIPDGAEVVQVADLEMPEREAITPEAAAAAADIELLAPTALPEKATLVDTTVIRGAVVQQYSLPDGQSFTVAQGKVDTGMTPDEGGEAVSVRGVAGTVFAADSGERALLTWVEGDTQFWIGGDLSIDQTVAIADSLE